MASLRRLLPLAVALLACPAHAGDDPGLLIIYPGHGSPHHIEISGRLIEDEGVGKARVLGSRVGNLVRNARRLDSDEIEGALVEVSVAGQTFRARTDDDGVWSVSAGMSPALTPGAVRVDVRVIEDEGHPTPPAAGVLHVFPASGGVAVLSDFDDTVVHTHVTSKRKMLEAALLANAAQLKAVDGAGEAYSAAVKGGFAGVFYLSGSPQNFMPKVLDFLRINGFPAGPVVLKNFGQDRTFDQVGYKLGHIRHIFAAHPKLRFVLVGDSGERDPEIYGAAAAEHPGRVVAIVIRRVPGADNRAERFSGMTAVDDFDPVPAPLVRPPLVNPTATE